MEILRIILIEGMGATVWDVVTRSVCLILSDSLKALFPLSGTCKFTERSHPLNSDVDICCTWEQYTYYGSI